MNDNNFGDKLPLCQSCRQRLKLVDISHDLDYNSYSESDIEYTVPSRMLCDCKSVNDINPIKNHDGDYVCATCGIVLPDDFDPTDASDIEELYALGTEIDFSGINYAHGDEEDNPYANRLRNVQSRVDEDNDYWIEKKHEMVKSQASHIASKLEIPQEGDTIEKIVKQLIEHRMQDFQGYDLLPPLSVVIYILDQELHLDLHTVVETAAEIEDIEDIDVDDLKKYYTIYKQLAPSE